MLVSTSFTCGGKSEGLFLPFAFLGCTSIRSLELSPSSPSLHLICIQVHTYTHAHPSYSCCSQSWHNVVMTLPVKVGSRLTRPARQKLNLAVNKLHSRLSGSPVIGCWICFRLWLGFGDLLPRQESEQKPLLSSTTPNLSGMGEREWSFYPR